MDIIVLCAHFQHEPMQKHVLTLNSVFGIPSASGNIAWASGKINKEHQLCFRFYCSSSQTVPIQKQAVGGDLRISRELEKNAPPFHWNS